MNMNKQKIRQLRPVHVTHVSDLNERMKRIHLGGVSIAEFADALPAAWVKVFFTGPDEPEGPGRAYTIRSISRTQNELVLDFVQHGEGPAASWSRSAQKGDVIRIAGPREGLAIEGIQSLLLFGDETAIPGIFAIIEALEENVIVKAFVAKKTEATYTVPDTRAVLSLTWLNDDNELADHVISWIQENSPEMVWGSGEHSVVIPLRRYLFQAFGRSRKNTTITAYWKSGEADHRDIDD
ncbi:siderophore-interacting protein [Leclercia barmai]|uniref:siderophore-interacting protein n=1 Tax=Leclercia barmai TaxID=2785629 RepID=UPI003BB988A1|nr:siderophore-interacting protein [Enterobacter hormaechei subsp. steigerwaltii]